MNSANAITAVTLLEGFDIGQEAIEAGLQHAHWPGRLERMANDALPPGWELWMDGGHNMAAGHMLATFIEEAWGDKPTTIIFGTTQGKDVKSLLLPLVDKVVGIYAIPVISESNSYDAETILRLMQWHVRVHACESVEDAIIRITSTHSEPGRILVFGSLYLRVLVAA